VSEDAAGIQHQLAQDREFGRSQANLNFSLAHLPADQVDLDIADGCELRLRRRIARPSQLRFHAGQQLG